MKYTFNLINIAFLTITIFIGVDIFYKYLIDLFIEPSKFNLYSENINNNYSDNSSNKNSINQNPLSPYSKDHYDVIYKRDIFKTSNKSDDKESNQNELNTVSFQDIESLEKTALKLKLWGTVTGGNDSENYAVIESEKDKKQELYKKGDKIEDAVIKKILRLSVVLSRNGKDELLEITEEDISNKGGLSKRGVKQTDNSALSGSASDQEQIEFSIKRSLIEDSMQDINSLMSQVRARPHFTGGSADGILLYGIKQNSMFKNMGIQNGDIIMGVDGKEIRSVEDAVSLYDRLKNSNEIKMQIRRRGQIKELLYNVE